MAPLLASSISPTANKIVSGKTQKEIRTIPYKSPHFCIAVFCFFFWVCTSTTWWLREIRKKRSSEIELYNIQFFHHQLPNQHCYLWGTEGGREYIKFATHVKCHKSFSQVHVLIAPILIESEENCIAFIKKKETSTNFEIAFLVSQ